MPHEDRGTAVALSLGGRAGRIAQGLPHALLGRRDGLFLLLQRIERELGAELQDRVRQAGRSFMKFRRPRNMQAAEYISEFERLYAEGVQHGLYFNPTMLSMLLLEHAGLSNAEENWILQTVAADWAKYPEIRTAFRRLPSLDTRHTTETHNWPTEPEPTQSWPANPKPFQDQHLNVPAPEPWSQQGYSVEEEEEWDSESDDDFCSSCPSDMPQEEFDLTQQAWAFHKSKRFGKGNKRHRRTGQSRPKNTWALDTKRNLNSEVPQGWDKTKWLSRTPCPGCGSRWHRNCEGKGKTFALFKKKKGGGKGSKGGKGGGKPGGKNSFGVFAVLAATMLNNARGCMLSAANSICLPQCFQNLNSTASSENFQFECQQPYASASNLVLPDSIAYESNLECSSSPVMFSLSEPNVCASAQPSPLLSSIEPNVLQGEVANVCIPPQITDHEAEFVFHAHQVNSWLESHQQCFRTSWNDENYDTDPSMTFVGLELKDKKQREERWSSFHSAAKQRYGLLMDTGAPQSCVGTTYFERFCSCFNVSDLVKWRKHSARLSGIGEGAATCEWLVQLPVGLETGEGYWQSQLLGGIGNPVPPLLGLEPMTQRQAIIDLRDPQQSRVYKLHWNTDDNKTETLKIYRVNGHLILPIDWGGTNLPDKQTFMTDPLGLSVFTVDEHTDDHTDEHRQNTNNTTETATTNRAEECEVAENFNKFDDHDIQPTTSQEFVAPVLNTHTDIHHERPPGLTVPNASTQQSQQRQPEQQGLHAAHYGLLKQMRNNTRAISKLVMNNRTYQTKYRGLPLGTAVPPIEVCYTKHKQWHFWEWWAGKGNLTRIAEQEHMIVGPPITWATGWCLKLEAHRNALKHLLSVYCPMMLFGAPTCSPWSSACTTLQPEVKEQVRREELEVFVFFVNVAMYSTREVAGTCMNNREPANYSEPLEQRNWRQPQIRTTIVHVNACMDSKIRSTRNRTRRKPQSAVTCSFLGSSIVGATTVTTTNY